MGNVVKCILGLLLYFCAIAITFPIVFLLAALSSLGSQDRAGGPAIMVFLVGSIAAHALIFYVINSFHRAAVLQATMLFISVTTIGLAIAGMSGLFDLDPVLRLFSSILRMLGII